MSTTDRTASTPTTESPSQTSALDELKTRFAILSDLSGTLSLLGWDRNTYMPPGGAAARAQQTATISRLSHELLTERRTGELLDAAEREGYPEDSEEAATIRVARRAYDRAAKLPADFVADLARLRSEGQSVWAEARREADFSKYAPTLEKMIDLTRKQADLLGYDDHPYDALHDLYETGSRVATVREVFAELRDATVALLKDIRESGRTLSNAPVRGHFPAAAQETFGKEIASAFGYSFKHGRLDPTVHPFASASSKYDARITTRYDESFLSPGLFGTMHEAGHAMYEQNVSSRYDRSPLAHGTSLGVHESQSRLWENLVGRSYGFWQRYFPRAQELFPEALGEVSLGDFYAAVNQVAPSFIRVEADEITYNLHIMVRFELELAILEGRLEVAEIPEAWNSKYQDYLGITPPDAAKGALQDVHWSMGLIGYFPTYTLGNIMSVQLFEAAKRAHPDLESRIAQGEFATLLGWLRENVLQHGTRYEPRDLLKRVTGSDLNAGPYVNYLNTKFRALYGLS